MDRPPTVVNPTGAASRAFFVKGIATGQVARADNFQRSVDTPADQIVKDMVAAISTLANPDWTVKGEPSPP